MSTQLNLTICHPRLSSGQNSNTAILAKSLVPSVLPANHVLIKVDRFGYSANNLTYQALGEVPQLRYFDFHEAPEAPESGVSLSTHGVTPVWGFGTVVASTHLAIHFGERVYGYFAPTRFLVFPVLPSDVNQYAFTVSRPHFPEDRRPYNQITRCSTDPLYNPSPSIEDLTMLYRPLFWTSFWCEDWINTSQYRGGASRILISSASAKTAFCLAYLICKRGTTSGNSSPVRQVVGLTSRKNSEFTKNLGLYDHVLEYDGFENATVMNEPSQKWIYIDVAGNESLNSKVFNHFSDAKLELSRPQIHTVPLSTLERFFMPKWFASRRKEISVEEITRLQQHAWSEFMQDCRNWGITIRRVSGAQNVKQAYEEVVRSGIPPDRGLIWSLWEEDTVNARL
ncbi:hypothetical protein J3R82DRAFT_7181 [Butyriboletus roseoflavus]|nr:hypothetical protein J3R82DRAFT_7181 [Butyriboletus roseoflavus]